MLRADSEGTGTGTVNILPLARVDFSKSTGTVSIYYNPRGESDKYRHANQLLVFRFVPEWWRADPAAVATDRLHAGEQRRRSQCSSHEPKRDLRARHQLRCQHAGTIRAAPEFHRRVRRPGSNHRQPDHRAERLDHPQYRAVRRHRPQRRRAESQPDECRRDRQPGRRVPDRWHAGRHQSGNGQWRQRYRRRRRRHGRRRDAGRSHRQQLRQDPIIGRVREHSGG